MRREQIVVGKTYRDKKGGARRVYNLRQLDNYSWAVQVEYQVTHGGQRRAPDLIGPDGEHLFRCDIVHFQRWAKA